MCDCDRDQVGHVPEASAKDYREARQVQAQEAHTYAPRFDESAKPLNMGGGIYGAGVGAAMAGTSTQGALGSEKGRLSAQTTARSTDAHARVAVIQKRLNHRLESQHSLATEIRELRRALDLSRQYDIAALSEYLELIQKHGL